MSKLEYADIIKAAVRLRAAELHLGKKLLPYTLQGKSLALLSARIGIKTPLLKELTGVALGVRRRHSKALHQLAQMKKAG